MMWILVSSFMPMSMNYIIEPDIETTCHERFPSGLSHFFEQVGAYDDQSEVRQVEKILDIDLSAFQQYDYIDDNGVLTHHWKGIKKLDRLLSGLLLKIQANPNYYQQVKYNPIVAVYGFSSDPAEMAAMEVTQQAHQNHPMFGYPNDHGYLEHSGLVKDVKALKALLHCYQKAGATKVALSYY